MIVDNFNFKSFINDKKMNDTAIIIASYQPNKVSSELLRIALSSIEKINLDDISVWIIDVGSPKKDYLVKSNEFNKFNFIYVDYSPITWEQTPLLTRIIKTIFLQKAPRAGSYANAWSLEFALSYFEKINYFPNFFMSLQSDIIFTNYYSITELREKIKKNKNIIAGGYRVQKNLGKNYDVVHSLACMWNLELFKKLKLNFYPDLPNYDIGEKAIAIASNKGHEILGYRNLRIQKLLSTEIIDDKYLSLGDGVDVCVNNNLDVVFLHLGRGIEKSRNTKFNSQKFSPIDWINWYKKNF